MNVDKQTHLRSVEAIRSRNVSQEKLDALKSIVAQNRSSQLVDDLICKEKADGRNEEDAVSETMLHLESLADTAPFLACVLMAHLSPIAGRLLMHDIVDGIGLWLSHNPSDELARHLRLIAASRTNPSARKKYEGLAEFIENTRKRKGQDH